MYYRTRVLQRSPFGTVFLFDMGVIVLVVGARTSVLDRGLSVLEVFEDGPVQKFASVIAVKSENIEREFLFDIFDGSEDTVFSFSPYGSLLAPSGGDIYAINGKNEHSFHRSAAVSYSISLYEAWPLFIPLIGGDRNVLLEQRSRPCGTQSQFTCPGSHRSHQTVDGSRRRWTARVTAVRRSAGRACDARRMEATKVRPSSVSWNTEGLVSPRYT